MIAQMGNAVYTARAEYLGGKQVFFEDSGANDFGNVKNGNTVANAWKNGGKAYAGDLFEYSLEGKGNLLKVFKVKTAVLAAGTEVEIEADGWSHTPEVGNILMKEVASATTTGASAKVTDVVYDEANGKFTLTLSVAIGALSAGDILVEAAGDAASTTAKVLVPNPNTFVLRDTFFPASNAVVTVGAVPIATAYGKKAYVDRMSPVPKWVQDLNTSRISGLFGLMY